MTKGELKEIIREVVKAELSKESEPVADTSAETETTETSDAAPEKASEEKVEEALTEGVTGPGYIIKAWDNPELKSGTPSFDSEKEGKLYSDFDDVLAALNSGDLDGLGAYEITWIQSGKETE